VHKLLYFLVAVSLLSAAEYGTIRGRVIDATTQEPIPNTRVTISDIGLSTYTDNNGEYCIHFIPLGTYRVVAEAPWYSRLTYTHVTVVGTHVFDFSVQPSMLDLTEYVIKARQPQFNTLDPLKATVITANTVGNLPVTTIDELLRVQPGFVKSEMGLHANGGRANEIAYYIDGIQVPAHINVTSLEIIKAYTRGSDVEYGNALDSRNGRVRRFDQTDRFRFHHRDGRLLFWSAHHRRNAWCGPSDDASGSLRFGTGNHK